MDSRNVFICFFLASFLFVVIQASSCPQTCDPNECPDMEGDCLAGMIMDTCNCCLICGRREGERCFSEAVRGKVPDEHEDIYTDCGQNLVCTVAEEASKEAVCVCSSPEPVCSSQGTAENECQFLEARYRTRSVSSDIDSNSILSDVLTKLHDGPCKSVPQIVSPPEDITNNTGSSVAFSCEVSGWPLPTVEWRVIYADDLTEDSKPKEKSVSEKKLVADGKGVYIQELSGPRDWETTSWLQLVDLKREDSGRYACVALNSEGEVRATAILTIGNFKREFPLELK